LLLLFRIANNGPNVRGNVIVRPAPTFYSGKASAISGLGGELDLSKSTYYVQYAKGYKEAPLNVDLLGGNINADVFPNIFLTKRSRNNKLSV
jgi:hypothetical protein